MNPTRNRCSSQNTTLQKKSQSQQITDLQLQLESREKAFKSLLAEIQDFKLQTKPTLKENLGNKSKKLTHCQTVSTPLPATTPKCHTNQLQMAEIPEAFIKTEEPMESICKRVLRGLPINFYDAVWFNNQTAEEKTIFSNTFSVEYLPDVSRSLWGRQHPDKQSSDGSFSQNSGSTSEVKIDEEDIGISEEDMDDINSGQELEEDPSFFIYRDTEMNNVDGPSTFASGSKDVRFSNEWAGW
ncbi:hypothetical protein O181_003833 [Austropuccinia psidii MF-1]|uniref:Uncharacterized protein n=1 Tax=Austropuccinia psidii MF-1 TaxID=1389203 RepID=A0A9Q3BF61_9BASI|nr:hypothetical protein [Austropuccinia psidii MF-1]